MQEAERTRVAEVRRLFQLLFLGRPKGKDVLTFYSWLSEKQPSLIPKRNGDPYQQLKSDLSGLFTD